MKFTFIFEVEGDTAILENLHLDKNTYHVKMNARTTWEFLKEIKYHEVEP